MCHTITCYTCGIPCRGTVSYNDLYTRGIPCSRYGAIQIPVTHAAYHAHVRCHTNTCTHAAYHAPGTVPYKYLLHMRQAMPRYGDDFKPAERLQELQRLLDRNLSAGDAMVVEPPVQKCVEALELTI